MKLRSVLVAILAILVVAGGMVWRLADHDLDRRDQERFDFAVAGHDIAGTLWLPDQAPRVAVVLVHGDGAQDRSAAGGYASLINTFLDQGIAVAAWDKPGVGASGGNWLHQTMADRTVETRAALRNLDRRFAEIAVGAVGFSQAGWILPALTRADADFLVLIGAAVSWRDQGDYYTRMRLAQDGLAPEAIARIVADNVQANESAFGPKAQAADAPEGMAPDRWRFIQKNRNADSRADLARLDLPLLAIWGAKDLNVDASGDAAIYRALLAEQNPHTRILLWPDATHGLLKAAAYNWQLTENWSWFATLRFVAEGRHAYAPGALNAIIDWIGIVANPPVK